MKEFLKSSRRKTAFLLAVLLVLGNVNWEAVVRAEQAGSDPAFTIVDSIQYGTNFEYDSNGSKTIFVNNLILNASEGNIYTITATSDVNIAQASTDGKNLTITGYGKVEITIKDQDSNTISKEIEIKKGSVSGAKINIYEENTLVNGTNLSYGTTYTAKLEGGNLSYCLSDISLSDTCRSTFSPDDNEKFYTFTPSQAVDSYAINYNLNHSEDYEGEPNVTAWSGKVEPATYGISVEGEPDENKYTVGDANTITISSQKEDVTISELTVNSECTGFADKIDVSIDNDAKTVTITPKKVEETGFELKIDVSQDNSNYQAVSTVPITISSISQGSFGDIIVKRGEATLTEDPIQVTYADDDTINLTCENSVTSVGTWGIEYGESGKNINTYFSVVSSKNENNEFSVSLTPTAEAAGKSHTIVITKEDTQGNYSTASKTLTISVNNGQQSGISFTGLSNQEINEHQITVSDFSSASEKTLDISRLLSGIDNSATLLYQLIPNDNSIASFGTGDTASILTLNKPCGAGVTVKVVQTKAGYNETSASFTLKVLGTIKDLKFSNEDNQTIVYNPVGTSHLVTAVVGDRLEGDNATIKYSIVTGSTTASATVNESTGEVNITGVGTTGDDGCATVVVRATASHVNYVTKTEDYTFKVKKATQTAISDISVEGASNDQISYNSASKEHNITVSKYENGATRSYSIKSVKDADGSDVTADKWGDIVTLAGDTGILTLNAAGEITFTVTAKKDNYFDATKDFTLKVVRASQTLREDPVVYTKDPETDKYLVPYGKKTNGEYQFKNIVSTDKSCSCANHKVTYKVTSSTDGFASVGEDDGVVTFADMKVGDATITASIPACSHYSGKELSYDINVAFGTATIDDINISGEKNSEGWYKQDVTLKPKGQYTKIGTSQSLNGTFNTEISLGEAIHPEKSYYLQKDDGSISLAVTVPEIKVDKSAPSDLKIAYSDHVWETVINHLTFGFYAPKVTVTLEAKDTVSGVNQFEYWYTDENDTSVEGSAITVTLPAGESADWVIEDAVTKYTFSINADLKNKIGFKAIDRAGNDTQLIGDRMLVTEKTKPIVSKPVYSTFVNQVSENGVTKYFYKDQATLSFKITEANFWASVFNGADANVTFKINDNAVSPSWSNEGDVYSTTVKFGTNGDTGYTEDGEYKVSMTYADPCKNGIESEDGLDHITGGTGKLYQFDSNIIVIDRKAPVAEVTYSKPKTVLYGDTKVLSYDYDDPETTKTKMGYKLYYDSNATVNISITEKYFNASGVDVIVNQEKQTIASDQWIRQGTTDTYTYALVLSEGEHTVKVSYRDYADNQMEFESETIIVETAAPTADIAFTNNVAQKAEIDATDKQYYKVDSNKFGAAEYVEATVKITTSNFYVADVEFDINQESLKVPNTDKTYADFFKEKDGWVSANGVHTKTVKIPKDEGTYGLQVKYTGLNGKDVTSQAVTVVVDDTAPVCQDTTTYSGVTIEEQTDNGVRTGYVYGEPAVVKLELAETNFNADDVKLTVKKNGAETTADFSITEWSQVGSSNVYTCQITLGTKDGKTVDGDYQVFMEYTDRSNNKMDSYQSKYIIVDATKPSVDISYENDLAPTNTNFYRAARTATITVQDRTIVSTEQLTWNFTAKDITEQDVTITKGSVPDWTLDREGAIYTWTKKINLADDAIYSFSADGTDKLSKTSDTPVNESYTIDTTAPEAVKIEYSAGGNWIESVLNTISFGYYKEPVTVTLTARDNTSPIDYFVWNYTKRSDSNNTPAIAGGETDGKITTVSQSDNSNTTTATFTLTADEAKQYCGNISFTATNKAGIKSAEKTDGQRVIVVDTIAPTRKVEFISAEGKEVHVVNKVDLTDAATFNPDEKEDLILYYNDTMKVKFTITEANFYKEDVKVTVSKDGGEFENRNIVWDESATDIHTGTLTLEENGNYVVKMFCYSGQPENKEVFTDRSGNAYTVYESSQITIDKVQPTTKIEFSKNVGKNTVNDEGDAKLYKLSPEAFGDSEYINATIRITTKNFRASDVNFVLNDTTLKVPGTEQTYAQYCANKDKWTHSGTGEEHTLVVPFAKTNTVHSFTVKYKGLNLMDAENQSAELVVDDTAPVLADETVYSTTTIAEKISTEEQRVGYVYDKAATISLKLTEANFNKEDVKLTIYKNGAPVTTDYVVKKDWKQDDTAKEVYLYEVQLGTASDGNVVEGDYQVRMTYTDRSHNTMTEYVSKYIIIDKTKPEISINYGTSDPTAVNGNYYGSNRTVTITVQDRTIVDAAKLYWTLTAVDVKNDPISIPEGKESAWSDTGSHTWTKTIEFSTDAKYDFTVAPVDALGKTDAKQQSFTIDKAKPANLTIAYSCDTDSTNGKWYENVLEGISFGYYKKPITVTMTATDVTSPIQSFVWSYARQGDNASIGETDRGTISYDSSDFKQNGATATATFTLPQDSAKQYRGNISFTVTDMANNSESKADTEKVVVYDNIKPTRTVAFTDPAQVVKTTTKETVSDYDPNQKKDLTLYYNTDMTVTITVTEANFYPRDTQVFVNDVEISDLTWAHTAGTDVYIAQIPLTESGSYIIKMAEYSDRSENEALVAYESSQIIIDKYKPTLDVKFSDNIAKNTDDGFQYNKSQITEDGKATITVVCNHFRASDFVLNLDGSDRLEDAEKEEYIAYLKTDSNWTHTGNVHTAVLTFDKSKVATYNMKLYFTGLNKLVTETIAEKLIMDVNVPTLETVYATEGGTIQEKGGTRYVYGGAAKVTLNLTEDYFVKDDVILTVLKDGKACPEAERTISEWTSTGTKHTRTIELGTGDVDGDYQIFMSYTDRSGNAMESLVSRYCIVDTKKPVVNINYAANDPAALNTSFYGANRTATLTVQDRTIVESEKLTWAFGATNILGQAVTIPAANISDWSLDTKTHTWTRVVKLTEDAIYNFSLNGTDCLGKTSDTPVVQSYTMDTTAPVDLEIKYSEGGNWVDNVLGAISFGYYKAPITVSLIAKDITSPMDYFDWTYTKRADSNNTPETAGARITSFTQAGDTATATFTLTPDQAAQYCGNITFTATNKAGHQSAVKADDNRVVVADSISPTRVVEFTPATQVINKTSRQTVEAYDSNSKQDLILFYNKPMTITLKVTEANFYPQDAVVTVNDAETALSWTRNGDEYTSTVTLSADGDYVLKMTYADRSGNAMETYESSQITIDTVRPTITIDIVGSSPTGEYGDTKYYSSNTQAVVTIVEHNFRASDVTGGVVALSASDQGVGVPDFAAFLGNAANWVTNGDTHVATYPMTTDATYSFQATYTDLAKHDVSIATSKHCVDKEAPENVTLSYSTPVVETMLEAISFKFYNAQATATVTATDETAGVSRIVYSLLKAEGASDTNLELLEQTIIEDTITYNSGRRESSAQFRLPASDLRAGTQFNGTIKLVVYDRALNNVAYENNERVIIDNIAPQLDIQYNESTNERNNILYYGEDIHATLRMNEANFYREDVKVTVSRNNGGFEPLTVTWSDTNADVHIGNFTLSEDGDYVVMVEYADKSTNQMVSYTSEQMTIDTDMPVVTITGVENRKPYASGTVGFTVTVSDTNLDSDSFAPQFSAWVKEGNTIVQKNMLELGAVTVANDRNSCTYIVDNLPEDGIYTVSTSVKDMVGHTVNSLHMDNENGTENDFVRFSVNRNGSTYYIDDATTLEMLGSFVPYDKAGNVVVREVNPTALSDVTVTMFKDEKTIALEETNNFRFDLNHNEGEWYEYSYTIFHSNFEEDGIYSIVLHSKDEAEHVAENNLEEKNVTISFAIDSTNPVLIVSNLEDGATYNANSYTVYMQASDNLKLSEATVSVDGKTVGSWSEAEQNLSADDTYEFTINESNKAQKVSVSLVDKAGNRTTQDYSVTVTTNAFVRIINNKPLLFGIAGGATGAVAVPVAGVALFGKKKLFFVLLNKLKGVFLK